MSSKEIRIKQQEQAEPTEDAAKPIYSRDKNSPGETYGEYCLQLSMEEYGQLMRRALTEGCSPEELVSRAIQRLTEEEGQG